MLEKRWAPTVGTADLATKLGIYVGEVFIRNDSDLYWDYVKKPKKDNSFNEPVVYGFTPPNMKPYYLNVLRMCMPFYSNSSKGEKDKKTWYEWYQHWKESKEMYYSPDYCPEKFKKIWHELIFGPNKAKDESDYSPRAILQRMRES